MASIGVRLLYRRSFFEYYARGLITRILKQIPEMLQDEPDLLFEEIAERSWRRSELHALEIGTVEAIKIELQERHFYNNYGCPCSGYLAEAEVRFYGSAVLWSARPEPEFDFPLAGKAGTTHMRMRTFLDGKDFERFEEFVSKHVDQARGAVRELDASLVFFNHVAEAKIREQLADRRQWIESLRERRKRSQKR